MINDAVNLDEKRLRSAIGTASRSRDPFSTIDVIRLYSGGYHVNKDVPAGSSVNAEIGRFLARNQDSLGIQKLPKEEYQTDDDGNKTTTALWAACQQ